MDNFVSHLPCSVADGDMVHMLAACSGKDTEFIEQRLRSGEPPWALAKRLGVLGELREKLLARIFVYLDAMVEAGELSRTQADELIACYEMDFPLDPSCESSN